MEIFYVFILPFVVMSIYMIIYMRHIRRHDCVLYRFCQIRRDLMGYLRQHGNDMPFNDYAASRHLLITLNDTIHHYNRHKTSLFNGRRFLRFLSEYDDSLESVEVVVTDDAVISNLRRESVKALTEGFFAYTPLFKYELILWIMIFSWGIAVKLGFRRFGSTFNQLQRTEARLKGSHQTGCVV